MTSLDDQLHNLFRTAATPVDHQGGDVASVRASARRRQLRQRASVLLVAATFVAVAGVGLVVVGDGGDQVDIGDDGSPTTGPGPSTTASTPTTSSETTTSSDTTTTSETTTTSQPDSPPSPSLRPPDSQTPAAGTCAQPTAAVVEVQIHDDVPSPRCTQVTADQRLQIRNDAGQEITVSLGEFSATLAPGESELFDRPFGEYLQPGVHRVTAPIYGTSGPEIWLAG